MLTIDLFDSINMTCGQQQPSHEEQSI